MKKTLSISQTQSLIEMKGKLKTKRFGALVDSLSSASANHLGPYGGGKFRCPNSILLLLQGVVSSASKFQLKTQWENQFFY